MQGANAHMSVSYCLIGLNHPLCPMCSSYPPSLTPFFCRTCLIITTSRWFHRWRHRSNLPQPRDGDLLMRFTSWQNRVSQAGANLRRRDWSSDDTLPRMRQKRQQECPPRRRRRWWQVTLRCNHRRHQDRHRWVRCGTVGLTVLIADLPRRLLRRRPQRLRSCLIVSTVVLTGLTMREVVATRAAVVGRRQCASQKQRAEPSLHSRCVWLEYTCRAHVLAGM